MIQALKIVIYLSVIIGLLGCASTRKNSKPSASVGEELIKIRMLRLSGNIEAASKKFKELHENQIREGLSPDGVEFSTQNEEGAMLLSTVVKQINSSLAKNHFLKAKEVIAENEWLFSYGDKSVLEDSKTKMDRKVERHCANLEDSYIGTKNLDKRTAGGLELIFYERYCNSSGYKSKKYGFSQIRGSISPELFSSFIFSKFDVDSKVDNPCSSKYEEIIERAIKKSLFYVKKPMGRTLEASCDKGSVVKENGMVTLHWSVIAPLKLGFVNNKRFTKVFVPSSINALDRLENDLVEDLNRHYIQTFCLGNGVSEMVANGTGAKFSLKLYCARVAESDMVPDGNRQDLNSFFVENFGYSYAQLKEAISLPF